MEHLSDELVAAILGLLDPVERQGRQRSIRRHLLAPVCSQWEHVVRGMQHRLSIDFAELPGSGIGGEAAAEAGAAGKDETAITAEALLAGASLRAVVWLDVMNLRWRVQDAVLGELSGLLYPTLIRLELHCRRFPYGSHPEQLLTQWITQLTNLRHLTLVRAQQAPSLLGHLAALTHLALIQCSQGKWDVPPGITALSALRTLRVWGMCVEGEVVALGALRALRQLDMHEAHVGSLAWLQGLTQLTYLKLNNLNNWRAVHGVATWDAALRPLTQLQHLDLEADELEAVPPCVARLSALTTLRAAFNSVRSLPSGPYLNSLQRLDLAFTLVKDLPVPGSTTGAPPGALRALRHLSLGSNDDPPSADRQRRFFCQLVGLPSLAALDLTEFEHDYYGEELQQRLPALALDWYRLGCD